MNANANNEAERLMCAAIMDELSHDLHTPFDQIVLARKYGMNLHKLTDIFLRLVGFTINEYRMQLRIAEAKRLLTDTNDSIFNIGCAVGYVGSRPFSKEFKKITSYTPRDYRKRYGKNNF